MKNYKLEEKLREYISTPRDHISIITDLSIGAVSNKEINVVAELTTFQANVPIRIRLDPFVRTDTNFFTASGASVNANAAGSDLQWKFSSPSIGAKVSFVSSHVIIHKNYQNVIAEGAFPLVSA